MTSFPESANLVSSEAQKHQISAHVTHVGTETLDKAMNTSGSNESKPSSDAPAETTHPPLSALDLAHLAANLNPALCNSDSEAALLQAFAFYQLAARFVENNAGRSFVEIYNDCTVAELRDAPLMQEAIKKALRNLDSSGEREKSRGKNCDSIPKGRATMYVLSSTLRQSEA